MLRLDDAQRKLIDIVFSSGYGKGLPEIERDMRNAGWYWSVTNCKRDDGRTYAQDKRGNWFVMMCDYSVD